MTVVLSAQHPFWMGSLTRDADLPGSMISFETNPVDNGYQLIELNDSENNDNPPTAAGADERGGVVLLSTVSAEADDGGQLGSDNEFVKLDKAVYYEARIRFATSSGTTPAGTVSSLGCQSLRVLLPWMETRFTL